MSRSTEGDRRRKLIEGFDRRAKFFSRAHWIDDPRILDYPISLLNLAGEETVLEMGIGAGNFAKEIESHVGEIVGIDLSKEMLHRASDVIPKAQLLIYDCERLEDLFLEETFDLVVSRNLLHHVNIPAVLHSAFHILKGGGRLLVVEASVISERDSPFFLAFAELLHPGHVDYPSHDELLLDITENGFRVEQEEQIKGYLHLSGYLSSIARDETEKRRIIEHFTNASPGISRRYNIQKAGNDVTFMGFWSIVIARKE